jgi:hypothetical protein
MPSRAQEGIQVESKAHRTVAFVFTLLTFCCSPLASHHPSTDGMNRETQTWPPGPELREKAMSTAALGIRHPLKRISQSRASAASFEVSRFERGGGVGRGSDDGAVLCRAVRTSATRGLVNVPARTERARSIYGAERSTVIRVFFYGFANVMAQQTKDGFVGRSQNGYRNSRAPSLFRCVNLCDSRRGPAQEHLTLNGPSGLPQSASASFLLHLVLRCLLPCLELGSSLPSFPN